LETQQFRESAGEKYDPAYHLKTIDLPFHHSGRRFRPQYDDANAKQEPAPAHIPENCGADPDERERSCSGVDAALGPKRRGPLINDG
jgi:hypothetical protein